MSDFAVLGKYGKCFSTGLKAGFEYRVNIIFSIAGAIAPVVIQTALWIALYSQDVNETMFGFTFVQMVSYTVIAQLVSRLVRTGFEYDLDNDIRTGSLDRYLVKPVGYFGFRLFSFLGDKMVQSIVMGLLIAVSVAFLSICIGFPLTASGVFLFIAGMIIAVHAELSALLVHRPCGLLAHRNRFFVRGCAHRNHRAFGWYFSARRIWSGRRTHSFSSAIPLHDPVPDGTSVRPHSLRIGRAFIRSCGILDSRTYGLEPDRLATGHPPFCGSGELI